MRRRKPPLAFLLVLAATTAGHAAAADSVPLRDRPNVLWIVVEDASPHIGSYGETTIATPHLDRMAHGGVRFTNAVVTSPVCSPSRSAMVTGMYPTTLGAHNHCSQRAEAGQGNSREYHESYRLPIPSVPELFRQAGYHVTNSGLNKDAKTDYNFVTPDLYDPGDWKSRKPGQPFFAQVQLQGGKARDAAVDRPVDPSLVRLPPYYPDHPALRGDWAEYLNSWIKTDNEVGQILDSLDAEGVLDRTVVFFWTDHGVSHARGKQFLYDEGLRVPLILRPGRGQLAGTVRSDLVEHIDIAATSLALAGIELPDTMQGRDLLAADHQPREFTFSARDRCDETVDIIRSLRTQRWKYIRNFVSYLPQAQPNQYKDGKLILQTMRQLYLEGALTPLQSRVFEVPRPVEELYDLERDPSETVNLAGEAGSQERLRALRAELYGWMVETRDVGLIPEPILEDLGRTHGSKYHVLGQAERSDLVRRLIAVIEAGERGDRTALLAALESDRASLRYWAATWLGNRQEKSALPRLVELADDPTPAVRVAAALALCQLGHHEEYVPLLARLIDSDNLATGHYAIRALEQAGPPASAALPDIKRALDNPYEMTQRIARRLSSRLGGPSPEGRLRTGVERGAEGELSAGRPSDGYPPIRRGAPLPLGLPTPPNTGGKVLPEPP